MTFETFDQSNEDIWPDQKKDNDKEIWDTDYIPDNWEPEFMTIFVTWRSRVTQDSIRNYCDVYSTQVLWSLKLSLFYANYFFWRCCLVPRWEFYLRYRNNDMSPKTLGDGGRGLGWQHLVNGFVNPYLVKQNLNLFLMFLLSKWYIVFLPIFVKKSILGMN